MMKFLLPVLGVFGVLIYYYENKNKEQAETAKA